VGEALEDGDASSLYSKPSLTFVIALVNEQSMPVLIDTGASRSFIRASTLKNYRLNLSKQQNQVFWLADRTTSFSTIEEIQLNLAINNIVTMVRALVVSHLSCECILGMDWLVKYRVDIHISTHEILLRDSHGYCRTRIPIDDNPSSPQFPVKLLGSQHIPPYQKKQIRAFVPISSSTSVLFSPRQQLQVNKTIRVPDAVLFVDKYLTAITLYNDSDRICHLSHGTLLGEIELIDSQTSIS
jgi:hypothetical protein